MPPLPPRVGTVGLVAGQLARVSLFRHAQTGTHSGAAGFKINLLGLDGTLLSATEGELAPEHGLFFDYDLTAGLRKQTRLQFHADVEVPPGVPIGASLEVVDAKTGATTMPTDPDILPDPTHALTMGMVGVAAKQVTRLSVFRKVGRGNRKATRAVPRDFAGWPADDSQRGPARGRRGARASVMG